MNATMKKEIGRATRTLYGPDKVPSFRRAVGFAFSRSARLRRYVAIKAASSLSCPLTDKDIEIAVEDYLACAQHLNRPSIFQRILEQQKDLANLLWLKKSLEIIRRKAASHEDAHSYDGAVYELEKAAKGPISWSQKEKWREKAQEVKQANAELERITLAELEKQNHAEFLRYSAELKSWKQRKFLEREKDKIQEMEIDSVIRQQEKSLENLLLHYASYP